MFLPRSIIVPLCCLSLVLGPSTLYAAGFNCAHATDTVDKALCADPALSTLDGAMAVAYAGAMHEAGLKVAALQRDQRNWLSERDDLGYTELSGAASQHAFSNVLTNLYRERILFLQHINDRDAGSALVSAIQKTLPALWTAGQKNQASSVVDLLSADKMIITASMPSEPVENSTLRQILGRLPGKPEPHLLAMLKQADDQDAPRTMVYLHDADLGGIYTVEGTARCTTWTLFDVSANTVRWVDAPLTLVGNCWNTWAVLATFEGQPYAIREDTSLDASDIVVQPRQQGEWGAQSRLLIRFDHRLVATDAFCGQGDCSEERKLSMQYATRYDRQPLPQTLNGALSAQDASRFDVLRQHAKGNNDLAGLPMFGLKGSLQGTSYASFVDEATLFPVHFHGELLLGRIGQGHIGWRVGDDWLVGIWRFNGVTFEPVAGVVIARRRGNILLTAPMPSASISNNLH